VEITVFAKKRIRKAKYCSIERSPRRGMNDPKESGNGKGDKEIERLPCNAIH
jgi:hypothetical protein